MTTPAETEQQRIDRIVDEVLSGRRTLNDVRTSVDRLAGKAPGDYSTVNDAGYQTRDQVAARVRQIFSNRGVSLTTVTPPTPRPRPNTTDQAGTGSANPYRPDGTGVLTPTRPRAPRSPAAPAPSTPGVGDPAVIDPVEQQRKEDEERARRDSYARLQRVLDDYGLGSLGAQVQRWLIEGLSEAEITQRMRETNEFKTRFPAIEERRKTGRAPISPGEYVAYERSVQQMMRAAGLPTGFYDGSDDFTRFISNDLSLSELADRVTLAANAAFKAPPEMRDALARFGVGPGELTAYWLDPDKAQPLLERKYAAAELAGTATRTNFGQIDETTANQLVGLEVSSEQAEQGFGALVESKELFETLDRTEDRIGQGEQLDAVFGGNAGARTRIERRRRGRVTRFEGGGGFASGQTGLVGLGDADDV